MIKKILRTAHISRRHFNYLLNGDRNAAPATAMRLQRATGISKEVWVFGTARQRQQAWKEFQKQHAGGKK